MLELIRQEGVEAYEGSVRFVEAARDQGLRRRGADVVVQDLAELPERK